MHVDLHCLDDNPDVNVESHESDGDGDDDGEDEGDDVVLSLLQQGWILSINNLPKCTQFVKDKDPAIQSCCNASLLDNNCRRGPKE